MQFRIVEVYPLPEVSTVDTGYNVLSGDQKIWYVITEVRYKQYFQLNLILSERQTCIITLAIIDILNRKITSFSK